MPAAALMASGYVVDLLGGPIAPGAMAVVAIVVCIVVVSLMRAPRRADVVDGDRVATVLTATVVIVSLIYFLWLASPSELPVTNGPDVVHHLVLIHLIQRTGHLVHDSALNVYLLEMAGYTPGSHILAALIAAWSRVDAVRVVHPVAATFAALALGIVYVLAFRVSPGHQGGAWQACAAPLLALVPAAYTLGAFMHFFYFAQVAAGTFALAMLLSPGLWTRLGIGPALMWCALCAIGIVLTWPVWIVPPAAALLAVAAMRDDWPAATASTATSLVPAAIFLAVHALRNRGAVRILAASGAVVAPMVATFGVAFVASASIGAAVAIATRRAGAVVTFAFAVLLEAAALLVLSHVDGSGSVYLPRKMMFLLVPAAAVLGSLALAAVADMTVGRLPRAGWVAAVVPVIIAAILLSGRIPTRRQHGSMTDDAFTAGEWARDHLPAACVDYFSRYWLTGYWLHLDVLGNPRVSERMHSETFDFRDTVGKWIEGRGLPYAFVEDFDDVPKDARSDMAVLQRSGRAAIVRNLRPAPCSETPPSLWALTAPYRR